MQETARWRAGAYLQHDLPRGHQLQPKDESLDHFEVIKPVIGAPNGLAPRQVTLRALPALTKWRLVSLDGL